MFFDSIAYAMGGGGESSSGMDSVISFVPLILVLAIFYFLLYRPQQKRAKEQKDLLSNLRKGDYVLCSGFYGRITDIQDDILILEVDKGVRIRINRTYVVGLAEPPTRERKERPQQIEEESSHSAAKDSEKNESVKNESEKKDSDSDR